MTIKDEYARIIKFWENGMRYGDLYVLIVDWIGRYKMIIRSPSLPHLISRLCTEDIKMLVNDFIFGDIYADLRSEMC